MKIAVVLISEVLDISVLLMDFNHPYAFLGIPAMLQ